MGLMTKREKAPPKEPVPSRHVIVKCHACGAELRRTKHEMRNKKYAYCNKACSAAAPVIGGGRPRRLAPGDRRIDAEGYVRLFLGYGEPGTYGETGTVMEHRHVMEQLLGRPLLPGENVHHKNGDRSDNRPENLELWVRRQPVGQRVSDRVEEARAILRLYGTADERERYG